jgi:Zn-dependent M28 family amino/carboxypeptidase
LLENIVPLRILRCLLSAVLVLLTSCRPEEEEEMAAFDGQRAYAEVESLVAISPRDAGTPGALEAAAHIRSRLEAFGVQARMDTFTDMTPNGEKTFHNVIGEIRGNSDRWVILGSHFDTMPGIENFQGANDSGSSTGVLLELARMLATRGAVPQTGIQFAFFDGEEGVAHYIPGDGLHGSRWHAAQLKASGAAERIDAMILLDMVGDRDLHFTIPANSSASLVKEVLNAARDCGYRDRFSLDRTSVITDDHVPFLRIGIPAIDLIDFKYGSAPGLNDYWHTADDNLDHISAESLRITGEIVARLLDTKLFGANTD